MVRPAPPDVRSAAVGAPRSPSRASTSVMSGMRSSSSGSTGRPVMAEGVDETGLADMEVASSASLWAAVAGAGRGAGAGSGVSGRSPMLFSRASMSASMLASGLASGLASMPTSMPSSGEDAAESAGTGGGMSASSESKPFSDSRPPPSEKRSSSSFSKLAASDPGCACGAVPFSMMSVSSMMSSSAVRWASSVGDMTDPWANLR